MKYGVHEPYRFNERVEDGVWTYDAFTYLYFIGDEAFASGLSEKLKLSHTRELREYLVENEVTRFMHYAKGVKMVWRYMDGRWKLAGRE